MLDFPVVELNDAIDALDTQINAAWDPDMFLCPWFGVRLSSCLKVKVFSVHIQS